MATKEKEQKEGGKKEKGASRKKGGDREQLAPKEHTGVGLEVVAPRLKTYYDETIRPKLQKQFSLTNIHEIPKLTKIVLNVGAGEAVKQPKILDGIVAELELIAGQRPVRTRAKKSISNFGLRQGQEIGASVTLRGDRMWEFLDRLLTLALPRIRDFRGLSPKQFDGNGNYTFGLTEQVMFHEIDQDKVDRSRGMDITVVTTATNDDEGRALLKKLGFPFKEGN